MTKSVRAIFIAAGVLLVLGAVLLVLVLTKPKPETSEVVSGATDTDGANVYIVDKRATEVTSITVKNDSGSYTFTRQKRVVSTTDESGNITSSDEYYWTSEDLKGVPQSDTAVKSFITSLASLPQKSTVEENASDLEKYGLDTPKATAELKFEDGTGITMRFGIQNPADSSGVYYRDEGNKVRLINYYAAEPAFSDVKQFANLTMTESYDTEGGNELTSLKITRPDLEEPVCIRFMSEIAELAEDEDSVVSTFNTHCFTSPINAEIDVTKGKNVCYDVYALTMDSCEYLEQTEENLKKCGLDEPQALVEFKYGGKEYELKIGDAVREEVSGTTSTSISSTKGYYAVMKGINGIYLLPSDKASWVTFKVSDLISHRPLSPYIYAVENVEVTVPGGTYKFDIDGENKTFSFNDKQLNADEFRSFYQTLIGSVGEEMYTGEVSGTPIASVTFNYKSKYYDAYGGESDTLSYYESDDRKCIVVLNGTPIFKVRRVYVDRLSENVDAVLNGGKVQIDY